MTGPRELSLRRLAQSLGVAVRGVALLLVRDPNSRIHAAATILVIAAGVFLEVSRIEWCLLVFAIVSVWTAEALNTAVELLGDAVSSEHHPLVGQAKDVAAGAVLMAALGAALVGLLVFGPPLLRLAGVGR